MVIEINTDYENYNYFIKSSINTNNQPINVIATFVDRKFGANNFYTNNPDFNEYEETQTSLVGVLTIITKKQRAYAKTKFGNWAELYI